MRRQPLIIGAGPAGCAAAIRLGAAGAAPVLLERTAGPVDRVCGDFLSADTIALARGLGVDPYAMDAQRIERVRVVLPRRVIEVALPFVAVGLSRRRFDAALQERAVAAGADLRCGVPVRALVRDGAGWAAETGGGRYAADAVVLATGKHELRDWPRGGRAAGSIGMKMYYRPEAGAADHLRGTVELVPLPGGYAGLQPVEAGRVVLCLAARPAAFKAAGGWDGILAHLAARHPPLARLLAGAEALLPRPLAIAGVPYGFRARTSDDGVFRVGDQGAVIPSLTGDGMAIALWSGTAAADAVLGGVAAASWQRRMASRLGWQMGLAALAQGALLHAPAALSGAGFLLPPVLRLLARQTRVMTEP